MRQRGGSLVRRAVPVVAAVAAAWSGLLLGGGVTRADSPIDGVYQIAEGPVSSQGGIAKPCWDTPMRTKLDPTTTPGLDSIYDVQITATANQVIFSQPGSSAALLTQPLATDPTSSPGVPPNYVIRDQRNAPATTSSFADYWFVDGKFQVIGTNVEVDITWTFVDSPSGGGQCQTSFGGQISTPSAASGGNPGGIPVVILLAGAGVVATITVGGWRWRNRKGKPLTPPGDRLAPKVPPRCRDVATRHDNELEILNSLRDAQRELSEKLDRAETIHKNNIIKARMVFNLEIIQTVGGFVTDFALALRPSALRHAVPGVLGEQDTWRPPGSISSELSGQIAQANELWTNLLGKFHELANQIEMMKGTVAEAVENLPVVRDAKQAWEIQMNRLGEMIADLPKALALRSQIAELTPTIESARSAADATETAWRSAQRELSDAESAVNMARNQLPNQYWLAQKDLQNAEAALASAASRGPEDTLRLTAQTAVEEARQEMAAAERASADQVQKVADLQKAVDAKKGPVDAAWTAHQAAGKAYDDLVDKQKVLANTLSSQYSDLSAETVTQQGKVAAEAERQAQLAEAQGRQQLGRELMEKQAEQERTYEQAIAARELVNDLRAQAERSDTWNRRVGAAAGSVVQTLATPITYPVGLLVKGWEWAFGSAQSPQEIVDILVRGQKNIRILRTYLKEIEDRTFTQEQLVERLRTEVDACVNGVTVPPLSKPAQPSAPAASTPAG